MVDEVKGEVNVAPFTISSDEGMGIQTVKYATKALCVILKNHGIMAFGKNLEQAFSAAIYLEESCDIYISALSTGKDITILTKEQAEAEDAPRFQLAHFTPLGNPRSTASATFPVGFVHKLSKVTLLISFTFKVTLDLSLFSITITSCT